LFLFFQSWGLAGAYYIFNNKFSDTADTNAEFTVNATDLIREFEKNDSLANKKYAEKIIIVNGLVSEIESADSTVNIKMADTNFRILYYFFLPAAAHEDAKKIKAGQEVSIKGSCSGGAYSQILETEFITFKRCALNK
jgi:hypothetical protein